MCYIFMHLKTILLCQRISKDLEENHHILIVSPVPREPSSIVQTH